LASVRKSACVLQTVSSLNVPIEAGSESEMTEEENLEWLILSEVG